MELQNVVFNERVRAGNRTYFMDVKETKEGKPYLSLQESRKKDEGFEKFRILVFEDHLQDFIKALNSVKAFIDSHAPAAGETKQSPIPETPEEEDLPF